VTKPAFRPEIIVGLVGGAGTRLSDLSARIRDRLKSFGYESSVIKLSELFEHCTDWSAPPVNEELKRIEHLQRIGTGFRKRLQSGDAAVLAAIAEIRRTRCNHSGDPEQPISAHAYILHQLKHPDEVETLRRVYGPSFVLAAGHASKNSRISALAKRAANAAFKPGNEDRFRGLATDIIGVDDQEDDPFGQNTRDTYPKADVFVNLGVNLGEQSIDRFIDLLFGHPFKTPTADEYAMYQASAVALRSSDDSRQVGSAIVSLTRDINNFNLIHNADVIAVGMNEVPRGGGGFYWDGATPDARDQRLAQINDDRPRLIKLSVLAELLDRIAGQKLLSDEVAHSDAKTLATSLLPILRGTQFMNIGEFGRPVHAEMAALIDAARRGVAVNGLSMYVTTFPCHNCAKHIIAAGIRNVVYLEPYPKSRTAELYEEEVELDSDTARQIEGKVVFSSFTGIGPRQYSQLFSMSERGAKKGRSLKLWENTRPELSPYYVPSLGYLQYIMQERAELQRLQTDVYAWEQASLLPTKDVHVRSD